MFRNFQKFQTFQKFSKFSEMLKIFRNCQIFSKFEEMLKIWRNCQNMRNFLKFYNTWLTLPRYLGRYGIFKFQSDIQLHIKLHFQPDIQLSNAQIGQNLLKYLLELRWRYPATYPAEYVATYWIFKFQVEILKYFGNVLNFRYVPIFSKLE